jgi:hypothetical protein
MHSRCNGASVRLPFAPLLRRVHLDALVARLDRAAAMHALLSDRRGATRLAFMRGSSHGSPNHCSTTGPAL